MKFSEKLKQLREEKQMLQRHLAAKLDIDGAIYSRIERGERKPKKEQVEQIAHILGADTDELLQLWVADKVYDVIAEEDNPKQILNIVAENLSHYGK